MKAGDVNSVGGDQNKTIATNGTNVFVPSTAAVDMTPNLNSEDEANNANRNTIGDKKFDGVTPRNNKENIVKNINEMNEDNEFSASENSSGNENSVATEEQTPDSVSSECNGENLGMASEMLINMSQSSPSDLEQLEGKDQINEELKVSLRVLCKDVMKDVKTLESRHNIKAMDIAIRFAEHLKNNTSVKLYTLEKGSRSKRSPSNSTDITHDGLFLKASPFLLLAYNEMKALYRKSGIKRWDQSFKNFTWNVFNVLITLDKDLDSLNNYKLKKAHKYDLLQDKFTLYWLDPIEEVDSSSSDEFITNDLQNGKINSVRS